MRDDTVIRAGRFLELWHCLKEQECRWTESVNSQEKLWLLLLADAWGVWDHKVASRNMSELLLQNSKPVSRENTLTGHFIRKISLSWGWLPAPAVRCGTGIQSFWRCSPTELRLSPSSQHSDHTHHPLDQRIDNPKHLHYSKRKRAVLYFSIILTVYVITIYVDNARRES